MPPRLLIPLFLRELGFALDGVLGFALRRLNLTAAQVRHCRHFEILPFVRVVGRNGVKSIGFQKTAKEPRMPLVAIDMAAASAGVMALFIADALTEPVAGAAEAAVTLQKFGILFADRTAGTGISARVLEFTCRDKSTRLGRMRRSDECEAGEDVK